MNSSAVDVKEKGVESQDVGMRPSAERKKVCAAEKAV